MHSPAKTQALACLTFKHNTHRPPPRPKYQPWLVAYLRFPGSGAGDLHDVDLPAGCGGDGALPVELQPVAVVPRLDPHVLACQRSTDGRGVGAVRSGVEVCCLATKPGLTSPSSWCGPPGTESARSARRPRAPAPARGTEQSTLHHSTCVLGCEMTKVSKPRRSWQMSELAWARVSKQATIT